MQRVILAFCLLATVLTAYAATENPYQYGRVIYPKNYYLGINAGIGILSASGSSNVQVSPSGNPADSFSTNGSKGGQTLGVFLGTIIPTNKNRKWFPDYRMQLSLWHHNGMKVKGVHTATLGPFTDTYNYQYNVASSTLMINGFADIYDWKNVKPFVGLGLGMASVKTSAFHETPVGDASPVTETFKNKSKLQFAYEADLGVSYQYTSSLIFSLTYHYVSLGKVSTGDYSGYVSSGSIASTLHPSILSLGIAYNY